MTQKTFVLLILDGWGIGAENESNPIHVVNPAIFKLLKEEFPMTSLHASGISIGLPWGETGNSEVGHLTIGAGKVLYQHYPRITLAIRDGSFFENPPLKSAFAHAREHRRAVNLVGLLTKANVHAALDHLHALITMGEREGVPVKLHLFADGKDSPPRSIDTFLKEIPLEKLATLSGRYYAMDREGRWSLTQKTYETLIGQGGPLAKDPWTPLQQIYAQGQSEEFLPPVRFGQDKKIEENDAIIFFNFREDSIRQIVEAFTLKEFNGFPRETPKNLFAVTMTRYEDTLSLPIAFPPETTEHPLGKVLSDNGKTQLRVAETYKYAHVTYFFNAYREPPFPNEYRVLIPSLTTPHIDDQPQMKAAEITDRLIETVEGRSFDVVIANYANPDTIAHTGNYKAALAAVETMDKELMRFLKIAERAGASVIITSDHGNVEELFDPQTGRKETQHDPNPVPFYLVSEEFRKKKFLNAGNLAEPIGTLADIAPTFLSLMGITPPEEMSDHNLLKDLASYDRDSL